MDPAGRRARNVVLLVIFTVALPSLLLTVLGAIAVRNEEAAAKRRIEKLYHPVRSEVAEVFNQRFDALLAASPDVLEVLAAWPEDLGHDAETFERFVDDHPEATNFFVMAGDGRVVVPASPGAPLTPGNCSAALACFSFPPPEYANLDMDPTAGCVPAERSAALQALAAPDCAVGVPAEISDQVHRLLSGAAPVGPEATAAYVDDARRWARAISDPRTTFPAAWVQASATAVLRRLRTLPPDSSRAVIARLAAIATRQELFDAQPSVAHPSRDVPTVVGSGSRDWRRVVVSARYGDYTAGFELVPTLFEPRLEAVLAEKKLDDILQAYVGPVGAPSWLVPLVYPEAAPYVKKKDDMHEAAWALLTKTQLNWVVSLALEDPALVPNLAGSRSRLYSWALVLIGGALLIGIIYTVRSVIEEARLSRLKTDFVSSVSHDLRTPLTSIRMFSEMLHQKQTRSREEEEEFLGIIVEEAERLSRLVERILDFSRMEAGRKAYSPEPTEVGPLIERALRATKPMVMATDFEVNVDVPPGLPTVHVDRDAILEVLVNLISNAVKYSPDERKMWVMASAEPDGVVIRVKDRGIGIGDADQRRIFEKFFRVNTPRAAEVSGSGIGLSLVEHIVSAHGGAVTVESTLGKGSTFTVTLPYQPSSPTEPVEVDGPEVRAGAGEPGWKASSS